MCKISTLLATLAIALATISSVHAGPDHGKARGHGSKRQHGDPLLVLAYDVSDAAGSLRRMAERTARHRGHRSGPTLGRFHELDALARTFRKNLEQSGPFDRRVRHEFYELQRSIDRVRYAMHRMHAKPPVARQFARLDGLVRKLDNAYDMRLASLRHNGHRGNDSRRQRSRYDDDYRHSGGYVRISTRGDGSSASIGFRWGD